METESTAMDTTLPIILKFGSGEPAIPAFLHGALLTMTAPSLIIFILSLKEHISLFSPRRPYETSIVPFWSNDIIYGGTKGHGIKYDEHGS